MMKVSIITATYNRADKLKMAVESVLFQDYPEIEYIIVDGGSTDGTVDMLKGYGDKIAKIISEPDEGIYDAMNKGIKVATGDVVGILNSDDFFKNNQVISKIVKTIEEKNVDAVYGDVEFVNPEYLNTVVRYYSSHAISAKSFRYGLMPAHPSFYCKRKCFEEFGYYRTDYKIAADYELLTRFFCKHHITTHYIPEPFVVMLTGGASTKNLHSSITILKEDVRACRENGVKTNTFLVSLKYFRKVRELNFLALLKQKFCSLKKK